ncbi:MAG: hypothetical protein KJO82_15355 [Gammaproteobacteria bacterium]|nr:hypothetical protein [Gammaproteobacteria bacterium]
MSDQKPTDLPFNSDNAEEQALWKSLARLNPDEPSERLRREFYRKLSDASRPTFLSRLQSLFGFSGQAGWLTATACVLLGLGAGTFFDNAGEADKSRLAALEQNVSMLNRSLILDRLENGTASKRLRGVMDAAFIANNDDEIATALLRRATEDRVPTVRSAAIDALGPHLHTASISSQLMEQLMQAESPIVQLALIDLILRNGSTAQIDTLLKLAEDGALHPDLSRHIFTALKRDVA